MTREEARHLLIDVQYARRQVEFAKHNCLHSATIVDDCCQRALDAIERIEYELTHGAKHAEGTSEEETSTDTTPASGTDQR